MPLLGRDGQVNQGGKGIMASPEGWGYSTPKQLKGAEGQREEDWIRTLLQGTLLNSLELEVKVKVFAKGVYISLEPTASESLRPTQDWKNQVFRRAGPQVPVYSCLDMLTHKIPLFVTL
jgi:hypothetical protein